MDNQNKTSLNEQFMKALAIVGFIVVVILLAWLAVQIVRVLPGAFASLAQLAEDVNTPQRDISLDLSASNNVVNSQSSVEIMWTDLEIPGTYTFTYGCVEGVTANIRTAQGDIVSLPCDTPYTIEDGTYTLDVQFTSSRTRFADVSYYLTFTPENDDADESETSKTLTVVNAKIPLAGEVEDDTQVVATKPTTTSRTPATGVQYRYVESTTYNTPKSNPNGYTELAITFIGVGTIDSKNRFVKESSLEEGERGAIQFVVKNTGTKTSGTWTFDAELPNGSEYQSKSQDALKPEERSIVTIAFDGLDETGTEDVEVTIKGGNDRSSGNNSFSKSVKITR